LAAPLFLHRQILQEPLPWIDDIVRAQRPERLPVVLTVEEVRRMIGVLTDPAQLLVKLLYGSGLRLLEALRLRVKDVDFERGQLTASDPKWKHDRATVLPSAVTAQLREQIVQARLVHEEDLAAGWVRCGCPTLSRERFRPRRALAVGLSGNPTLAGPGRSAGPASPARDVGPARGERRGD
jgi:integrase